MLNYFSWTAIGLAIVYALWILWECVRRPQKMAIMNVFWPVTGPYFSLLAVLGYYRLGATMADGSGHSYPINRWLIRAGLKEAM